MYLPISAEQSIARPVTPVNRAAEDSGDSARQHSPGYIYRGELLETVGDRSYRPQYNLQISPENRRAITSYQKIASEQPVIGRILDGFI